MWKRKCKGTEEAKETSQDANIVVQARETTALSFDGISGDNESEIQDIF